MFRSACRRLIKGGLLGQVVSRGTVTRRQLRSRGRIIARLIKIEEHRRGKKNEKNENKGAQGVAERALNRTSSLHWPP